MAFKIFRKIADMLDLDETSKTAGNVIAVNATEDGYELVTPTGGGGGAPTTATYITQTANASLSAEQAMGSLATGLVKNTTTTGVQSIAVEGTDYYKPSGTDVAVADGGTGASTASAARTNLGLAIGTDVQAHDADLDTWAGLTPSSYFQTLVDDADAATARGTLGAAPVAAKYIVQTADSELSGEQALGALSTGILKNTTTTGVLSIAAANTDYAAATHASRHQSGGADSIALDTLAAPTDITTLNVSTSAHGLAPKLPNDATKYLDGTGAYTVPSGGGGSSELAYAEFTSNISITATTEATADTVVTAGAITGDGSTPIVIQFQAGGGVDANVAIVLYDGSSSVGGVMGFTGTTMPLVLIKRLIPSSGSHTYSIRAYKSSGSPQIRAGSGGVGNNMPGSIRIISS